jgi:hypothetical protein
MKSGRIGAERIYGQTSNEFVTNKLMTEWFENYFITHPNVSMLELNYQFIKDNMGMFLLSKLVSPLFFISLSNSTGKTLFNFVLNGLFVVIAYLGFRKVSSDKKIYASMILTSLLSYYLVYFLNASYGRYGIPFLFFFMPFAGIYICLKLPPGAAISKASR